MHNPIWFWIFFAFAFLAGIAWVGALSDILQHARAMQIDSLKARDKSIVAASTTTVIALGLLLLWIVL